jgi:hypothetical protein
MYLSCYHFDGDTGQLVTAYQRLLDTFPPGAIQFQVCVQRADGLDVYDGCPTRDEFIQFSRSPEFAAAVSAAGLPRPRIEELGEVHNIIANQTVTSS